MNPELMMSLSRCRDIRQRVGDRVNLDPFDDLLASLEVLSADRLDPADMVGPAAMRITPNNAVELLDEIVDVAMRRDAYRVAADAVADIVARRCLGPMQEHGAEVIEAMADPFNKHAARFMELEPQLPTTSNLYEPRRLIAAGAAVVAAVEEARALAEMMHEAMALRDWMADGLQVRTGSGAVDKATRYARLQPTADVGTIAQQVHAKEPIRLLPLLRSSGVTELRWSTLNEQAEQIAKLSGPAKVPA